jgi:hypothetical protein
MSLTSQDIKDRFAALDVRDARIAELEALLAAQVTFTEALRHAAIVAYSHASHVAQNYAHDIPDDKSKEWASASVEFNILSVEPSPAHAVSAIARAGSTVN